MRHGRQSLRSLWVLWLVAGLGSAPALAANVLAGLTGYSFSVAPNGSYQDTAARSKLTDGAKPWDFTASVQWNLAGTPGHAAEVTLDAGALYELSVFNTSWVRWESGAPLPQEVRILVSADGAAYQDLGAQQPQVSLDKTVCTLTLIVPEPVTARYVRFRMAYAGSGTLSLCEVEALQPPPLGDLIIGFPYAIESGAPNGPSRDAAGRKLTDGEILPASGKTVQWDFAALPRDTNPQITIELDRPTSITRAAAWWWRDDAAAFVLPEIVNVYGAPPGGDFKLLGTLVNETRRDKALNCLAWSGTPSVCARLAFVFNRGISNAGTVALAEVGAYGSVPPAQPHNAFGLGFVASLTCGSDVYFRPGASLVPPCVDPPPAKIPDIVKALHDHYYANTLYVEYNGEVDRAAALDLYDLWAAACAGQHVELVPVIGLVQWDYLTKVNPAAEWGRKLYFSVSPVVDIKNAEARAYFKSFVADLLARQPSIRRIAATDVNQFALARTCGYPYAMADYAEWTDFILAGIGNREKALIFQQPQWAGAPELDGIQSRLLDTYSYLLNETYDDLRQYVAQDVAAARHVEGDLVIVTDPGARFEPRNEVLGARAIESAGAHLSLDLIITAAIMRDYHHENFWLNLLDDGYYEGFYEIPLEAVRQRYRLHHGLESPPPPKSASPGQNWISYD